MMKVFAKGYELPALYAYSAQAGFGIPRNRIPNTVMLAVVNEKLSRRDGSTEPIKFHPIQTGQLILQTEGQDGDLKG